MTTPEEIAKAREWFRAQREYDPSYVSYGEQAVVEIIAHATAEKDKEIERMRAALDEIAERCAALEGEKADG